MTHVSGTRTNNAPRRGAWATSSYTNGSQACVEVFHTLQAVRDTKHRQGPILAVNVTELITKIKTGNFEREAK
jgi:hypothetical protein